MPLGPKKQFLRRCFVTILEGTSATPVKQILGYDDSADPPIGLRINFRVERKFSAKADTAVVRIWNLNAESRGLLAQVSLRTQIARGAIQEPIRYMQVAAGYRGPPGEVTQVPVATIFNGPIIKVLNKREGPDWITEIEASAALAQAIGGNNVDLSVGSDPGISTKSVLADLFSKAGYGSPRYSTQADGLVTRKKISTLAVNGSAVNSIERILASVGLVFTWDVDGGPLIVTPGNPLSEDPAEVLKVSEGSGLIGTPSIGDMGVNFKTLLDPRLSPGKLVELTSETLRESLQNTPSLRETKVTAWTVTMVGDTHENDWFCDVSSMFFPLVFEKKTGLIGRQPPPAALEQDINDE